MLSSASGSNRDEDDERRRERERKKREKREGHYADLSGQEKRKLIRKGLPRRAGTSSIGNSRGATARRNLTDRNVRHLTLRVRREGEELPEPPTITNPVSSFVSGFSLSNQFIGGQPPLNLFSADRDYLGTRELDTADAVDEPDEPGSSSPPADEWGTTDEEEDA